MVLTSVNLTGKQKKIRAKQFEQLQYKLKLCTDVSQADLIVEGATLAEASVKSLEKLISVVEGLGYNEKYI
jgi:hypothetical protein